MKIEDTEVLGRLGPIEIDTVDRPVRTARTFVHHYNSTQYPLVLQDRDSFLYIPLPSDQHHISDVAKWR